MDATPIGFTDFTTRLLAVYSAPRYARKTYLRIRQVLRELSTLGCITTADLTTATMAAYVTSRGPAANANTTNGLLGAAAAACSYAIEERWLDRAPCWRRVRPRATPGTLNRPRSYDDVARLLGHVHEARWSSWEAGRTCALVWTVALTGVRLGEALHAQVGDVDLAPPAPSLAIDPARHRLKTLGSARTVPVPAALASVLRDWVPRADPGPWLFPGVRRRGPWTGGAAGRRALAHLGHAAKAVGIERITWHSLRHAFGTAACTRWDVPLWVLQRVMGHSDLRTTARYLHTEGAARIAEALRQAEYRRAG